MNFGTYELQNIIYEQLVRGGVDVRMSGGRGKFSKDLAKLIYEFVEDKMNFDMQQIARSRGASDEQVKAWERVCKAFGRTLPMKPDHWDLYLWVVSQGDKTIERFAWWANLPENLPYINQYFKDPQNIKTQWERAFMKSEKKFTKNSDGSLYV